MKMIGKLMKISELIKTNPRRSLLILTIILVGFYTVGSKFLSKKEEKQMYQTAVVERGSLIKTISGSGVISSGNSTSITTGASGEIKVVYVNNGDYVNEGDKIAEIELDEYSQESLANAWVSYLDAKENLIAAQKNKVEADILMWQTRQDILDAESDIEEKDSNSINPETDEEYTESEKVVIDKTLERSRLAFAEAELKYKNAESEINLAKTKVASAYKDYQQLSSIVVAPSAGTVTNLALTPGTIIVSSSQSSESANSTASTTISAQEIGQINNQDGQLQATINLTEIDVVDVKANQKVTLTLDAFADVTFVGQVLAIDTNGSSNSGVTTYPVAVLFDSTSVNIYPNMAVNAEIVTEVISDVLLIPSSAIQSTNGTSVQVMKNGQPTWVKIETGETNGSRTVVISGLLEGDEIITQTISDLSDKDKNNTSTSVFGGSNMSTRGLTGGGGGVPPMGMNH